MGSCLSATEKEKPKTGNGGPVQHREAAANRVDENEMKLAELKSSKNKLKEYSKKMEHQIKAVNQKVLELAKAGQKDRAKIRLRQKGYLTKELDKIAG